MKKVIFNADHAIGPWVGRVLGFTYVNGPTIGLIEVSSEGDIESILSGVVYTDYNKASVAMHIAAVPGKLWLTREYLHLAFDYPFNKLSVNCVIGVVAESNLEAREFDEHLGFKLRARLEKAHPEGDLLVYVMQREECLHLEVKCDTTQ